MTGPATDGVVLAIDTATSRIVLAVGRLDGAPAGGATWVAGHRHGETLLPAIDALLAERGIRPRELAGIVVGTGPGTFTGLRVGIATAKGMAHGLGIPIVGVSSAAALLDAAGLLDVAGSGSTAGADLALLLPAGPQDRVLVHGGATTHLPAGAPVDLGSSTVLVAVDLDGRAPDEAVARGERAVEGFGAALLLRGTRRLAAGDTDDLAGLVPEYVTLPRGVVRQTGEVAWSRDPR